MILRMNKDISATRGRVAVIALCVGALLLSAVQLAVARSHAPARGAVAIQTPRALPQAGSVKVAIYLRDQRALTSWQKDRRAAKEAAGIAATGRHRFSGREKVRQSATRRLARSATRASAPAQHRLAAFVKKLGGRVTGSFPAPNMIYATVPAKRLARIERLALVDSVQLVGERRYLSVPAMLGADTWHGAGCTGAGAVDTCPTTSAPQNVTGPINSLDGHGGPDLGVDDQGVNCHHDAFTGGATPALGRVPATVRPDDAPLRAAAGNKGCPTNVAGDNGSLHGNTIAAVVAVKDPAHRGAAYGVDKILDPTRTCANAEAWLLGLPTYYYSTTVAPCVQGLTIVGAADSEEVQNRSYAVYSVGAPENTSDDSLYSQVADVGVTQFGVAQAIAAGNGGPYAPLDTTLRTCYDNPNLPSCQYRVEQPCISYNSICMGATSSGADVTFRTSDDVAAPYSSRGPSFGGRKKPDLVAPNGTYGGGCPDGGYSGIMTPTQNTVWKGTGICGEGTSYAAPDAAAGQILLAGVGITAPAAQKAILINSATQITKEATGTVQQFWAPDVGWGELDLSQAYADRGNFRTGSVTAPPTSNARFYRVSGQSAGDRTTLAWNRRVTVPLGSHGDLPPGYGFGFVASAVTTLNLYQLTLAGADNDQDVCGASTTCGVDASESVDTGPTSTVGGVVQRWNASSDNQDTVDQVRVKTAGDSIIKVASASPIVGASSENYALASTEPITPLATPTITTPAPTLSKSNPAVGENVTVTASAANDSSGTDLVSGLALDSGSVTVNLPAGVQLVSSAATQPLGTISPAQTKVASWTVKRTGEGTGQITFSASGQRFGETFASTSAGASITSDQTAPSFDLAAPSGWQGAAVSAASWTSSDAVTGIANVTVEASIDGGAFTSVYSGSDAAGSVPVTAAEGASVQLRARATDGAGNVTADSTASWKVDAIPPMLTISAPTSVYAGDAAAVTVSAQNIGSPITTSYRVSGGASLPLTGGSVTLASLTRSTSIDVTTTDQLGRSVTRSATITVLRRATSVKAKVSGRKAKRALFVTTNPAVSGTAKVSAKCKKKRLAKSVRITAGRGKLRVPAGAGRCKVSVRFTPADYTRYLNASYSKTLKF
jgi:hypothetical protein